MDDFKNANIYDEFVELVKDMMREDRIEAMVLKAELNMWY